MRIIITGGGTAGHVNPGIAIAKYYKKRHKHAEILFVGTKGGIEEKLTKNQGFAFKSVDIKGLKRSFSINGIIYNVKTSIKAIKSLNSANKIIKEFKPDVIIGCGGYASFSMVYAGILKKISTIVLEVNIYPGITTKILSKKCDKILLAFSDSKKYFDKKVLDKILVTGSPTMEDFGKIPKEKARENLKILDKPLVVSFWGSTGALYMNKKMVDFINLKSDKFTHIHATGKNSYEWFEKEVKNKENSQILEYIYNMPELMSASDLIICRGGAATLSELAILKKPAIIVPSPYVAENHQEKNARIIEKQGGCKVMIESEVTGKDILKACEELIENKKELEKMQINIEKFAKKDSNQMIYNELLKIKLTNS